MYHQISSFVLFSLSLSASLMNICSIRFCEIFYKAEINPRIGSSLKPEIGFAQSLHLGENIALRKWWWTVEDDRFPPTNEDLE